MHFHIADGQGTFTVEDIIEAESALLSYPDGSTIRPTFTLPHGLEFKTALATNAKRWWIRDEDMLGIYQDRYGAVATVQFTNAGCVG